MNQLSKYWIEREKKHMEESLKDDELVNKEIEKIYKRTLSNIESEIDGWIGRYAARNELTYQQASQLLSGKEVREYAKKAKEYVREKNFSEKANAEMGIYNLTMRVSRLQLLKEELKLAVLELGVNEEDILNNRLTNLQREELERQAGLLGLNNQDKDHIKEILKQMANDSSRNADFSDLLWKNKRQLQRDLERALDGFLLTQDSPFKWYKNLKRNVSEAVKNAEYVAKRLAVTEASKKSIDVKMASIEEAEFEEYQILAESGACKICKPFDNKHFKIKDAKIGINMPVFHPFCRCTVVPYMDREWVDNIDIFNVHNIKGLEQENSNKKFIRKTRINRKLINSSNYDKKFTNLDESIEIIRKLKHQVREILTNRDGTTYEDLIFIDTNNGNILVSHLSEDLTVKPTKNMSKMLILADPHTIIGVHNHPYSSIPSLEDILVAYKRKYKYGLIAAHNGEIFKYKVINEVDPILYNIIFDKIMKNGYNDDYKDELLKLGVELEVL